MDKIYLLIGNDTPLAVCLRKSEGEGDPVPYDLSTAERMRLALVGHGMHVFAEDIEISGEDDNIVSGVIPGRSLLKGDYDLEVTFNLDGRDKRFAVKDMFEAVDFLAEDQDGTAEGEGAGIFVTVTVQPEVIEIAGPTGPQGHDGKSAYEVWLDEGHSGTEEDFFAWIAAQTPNPDWNQNDSTKPDFIKNRTHYEETGQKMTSVVVGFDSSYPWGDNLCIYEFMGRYDGRDIYITRFVYQVDHYEPMAGYDDGMYGLLKFYKSGTSLVVNDVTVPDIFDGSGWPTVETTEVNDITIGTGTVHKLDNKFLDMDSEPTTGSGKPVTSGGVKAAIADFVTRAVNDLANYYLKSETYTKAEVASLIGAIQHFHYEIYPNLESVTHLANNILYLIGPTGTGSDKYEEYVYDSTKTNPWVKIGDTSIDLSGYVTTEALNTALGNYVTSSALATTLANYVTSSALTTALAAKQDALVSGENIKTVNGQSILGSGDIPIEDASDAVKYTSQSLTDAQKTQARTNIAAASDAEVSQLRSEVEGFDITNTIKAAGVTKDLTTPLSAGMVLTDLTGMPSNTYVALYKDSNDSTPLRVFENDLPLTLAHNYTRWSAYYSGGSQNDVILVAHVAGDIDELDKNVDRMSGAITSVNGMNYASKVYGRYVKYEDGTTGSSANFSIYKIKNTGIKWIAITAAYSDSIPAAIAFYSSEDIDSSGYMQVPSIRGGVAESQYVAEVPDECKLIVVSNRTATLSSPSITIGMYSWEKGLSELKNAIILDHTIRVIPNASNTVVGYRLVNGNEAAYSGYMATPFIEAFPGMKIHFKATGFSNFELLDLYDSEKNFIGTEILGAGSSSPVEQDYTFVKNGFFRIAYAGSYTFIFEYVTPEITTDEKINDCISGDDAISIKGGNLDITPVFNSGIYIDADLSLKSSNNWKMSEPILVKSGAIVAMTADGTGTRTYGLVGVDSPEPITDVTDERTFTPLSGTFADQNDYIDFVWQAPADTYVIAQYYRLRSFSIYYNPIRQDLAEVQNTVEQLVRDLPKEWVSSEVDLLEDKLLSLSKSKLTVFAFNTDQHYSQSGSYLNSNKAIARGLSSIPMIAERFPFDLIVLGGDEAGYGGDADNSLDGVAKDVESVINLAFTDRCPVIAMSGNHDAYQNMGSSNSDGYQEYNWKTRRNVAKRELDWSGTRSTNCWYDDKINLIRFVFLDSYSRNQDNEILSCVDNALSDEKLRNSNWKVIIFSHNVISSAGGNNYGAMDASVWTAISGYIGQGVDIVACINGHAHNIEHGVKDGALMICVNQALPVSSGTTAIQQSFDGNIYHNKINSKIETAYTVFAWDRTNNKLYAFQYGAGTDRVFNTTPGSRGIELDVLSGVVSSSETVDGGTIKAKNHNTEYSLTLDSTGEYSFPYLCPGLTWEITVELVGGGTYSQDYNATTGTHTLDITVD